MTVSSTYAATDWEPLRRQAPRTFDLALKEFGINSPWLRTWVAETVRANAHLPVPGGAWEEWGPYYWLPESRQYVAVGFELHIGNELDGLKRSAVVQRGSLRIASHPWDGTAYAWRTIPFPDRGARQGTSGPQHVQDVCPTCFVQVPMSGRCDNC